MKKLIVLIVILLALCKLYGQTSSRNGYFISNKDTIRLFLVYAEAINDPGDTTFSSNWLQNQMPSNPEKYLDSRLVPDSINGWVTNYFYQASFGQFIVLGDYFLRL